jgi:hypothetical protein
VKAAAGKMATLTLSPSFTMEVSYINIFMKIDGTVVTIEGIEGIGATFGAEAKSGFFLAGHVLEGKVALID